MGRSLSWSARPWPRPPGWRCGLIDAVNAPLGHDSDVQRGSADRVEVRSSPIRGPVFQPGKLPHHRASQALETCGVGRSLGHWSDPINQSSASTSLIGEVDTRVRPRHGATPSPFAKPRRNASRSRRGRPNCWQAAQSGGQGGLHFSFAFAQPRERMFRDVVVVRRTLQCQV